MNAEIPVEEAAAKFVAEEPVQEAAAPVGDASSMFEEMTKPSDEDAAAMFGASSAPAPKKNGGKKNFSFDMSELIKDAEASIE